MVNGLQVPNHLGVIIDGNRRWARARGMKPWMGHWEGVKNLEEFLIRLIEKVDCDDCRELKKLYGKEPSCEKCLPEILPENVDAMRVFNECRSQLILSPVSGFPIDVNILAVDQVVKDLRPRVRDPLRTKERVISAMRAQIKFRNEKAELEALKSKE